MIGRILRLLLRFPPPASALYNVLELTEGQCHLAYSSLLKLFWMPVLLSTVFSPSLFRSRLLLGTSTPLCILLDRAPYHTTTDTHSPLTKSGHCQSNSSQSFSTYCMLEKHCAKCFPYSFSFTPHNTTGEGSFCYPHFTDDEREAKWGETDTSFINLESGLFFW